MKTLQERFDEKWTPEPTTGCWLWTASLDSDGYGHIRDGGRLIKAHRVVLGLMGIDLIDGLVVDHTCRVRGCVNPAHLRQVTDYENVVLAPGAMGISAINRAKTHCVRGHALTGENVKLYRGRRYCLKCRQARNAARGAKKGN